MIIGKLNSRVAVSWGRCRELCQVCQGLPTNSLPLPKLSDLSFSLNGIFVDPDKITCAPCFLGFTLQTSLELRRLSRSLSGCQSLTLNVMISVSQFVRNSLLCHLVTKPLNCSQCQMQLYIALKTLKSKVT